MAEDIVEFGATPPRKPKRPLRLSTPKWLDNRLLPVAGAGVLAGAASLVLPWQKIVLRPVQGGLQQGPNEGGGYEAMLISLGAFGTGYLLTLIATIAVIAVIFFGNSLVPGTARVIGTALSAANFVLLATTAFAFKKATVVLNVGFVSFGPEDLERMNISLDGGYLAALAAVLTLGAVALFAKPVARTANTEDSGSVDEGEGSGGDEDGESEDDGVIDLSVSVHPVGKQVAAG